MTSIRRFNFSSDKQITVQKADNLTNFLWLAFAKNLENNCIIEKVAKFSPTQTYYSLNREVDKVVGMDLDLTNLYVAYEDATLLGEIISKSNPLSSTITISKGAIVESPVDTVINDANLFYLLPGIASGTNAKLVRYNTLGVYQDTIDLPGVYNANSIVTKVTGEEGVPNDVNTNLLLHCNGDDTSTTFDDSSSNDYTITPVGNAQISTEQYVFGGASGRVDGIDSYLSVPNSTDWNFGTGDFTIDLRVRFASVAGNQGLFGRWTGASSYFYIAKEGNSLRVRDFGGSGGDLSIGWTPSVDTWYHIAVVKSSGTLTAYVDGTSIGSISSGAFLDRTVPLYVGTSFTTGYFLDGWLDDVRVSKGIARWTSNFTIPEGIGSDMWLVTYENPVKLVRIFETFTDVFDFEITSIV